MPNHIFNFITRFLFFWIISALVLQKTLLEAIFFGLIMSAGFTLFDFIFGSPGNLKKQNDNIVRIAAGYDLTTTKDKWAWVFVGLILLVGGLFAVTGIIYLFAGDAGWIWIGGAAGSLLLYWWVTQSAKHHIHTRRRKKN